MRTPGARTDVRHEGRGRKREERKAENGQQKTEKDRTRERTRGEWGDSECGEKGPRAQEDGLPVSLNALSPARPWLSPWEDRASLGEAGQKWTFPGVS